jgi:hypothetical protein
MSGTTDPVVAPTDNAEWARDTDARLSALENPTSTRVGSWVLSTSADGNLIASNVNGGSVVLATPPAGGESDPDAIQGNANPSVAVTRIASFTLPTAGGPITFDGVQTVSGGDWTSGKAGFAAITVPVAGTYCVLGAVQPLSGAPSSVLSGIMVNGSLQATGNGSVFYVASLRAGDAVSLFGYTGSATAVGANASFAPPVPTILGAFMVTTGS